jgi:hypothetical protein
MDEPEIPPKLKERWEKFAEAARKCWAETEAKVPEDGIKRLKTFWSCMEVEAKNSGLMEAIGSPTVTPAEIKKCAEIGHPLAPAPICVLKKVAEDKPKDVAVKECLEEGKVHGISLLACRAALGE